MKYIITWVIIEWVQGACPPRPPQVDEFGRESLLSQHTVNAVACLEKKITPMRKEFNNRDSAIAFYSRAINQVNEVKIDSIP